MPNFHNGYLNQGDPLGALANTFYLTADNQAISVEGLSFAKLNSNNTTATNRTFTIANSSLFGQVVTFELITGSSTTCELANSGSVKLAAAWTPLQYQTLTLQWDGSYWVELGRSVPSLPANIALTDGHIFVGDAVDVAQDVAVTGDITISNAGVVAIASDVIVNADVKTDAAIA